MSIPFLALPRPGAPAPDGGSRALSAPSEAAFVAHFGTLMPQVSYLDTPNGRAAYYELTHPSQPPPETTAPISRVLFVHGVQTCAVGLLPLAQELSSRFLSAQCVLVDLWGHGLTDTPVVAHDAALFHMLLETLMAQLGWRDAHLVGYSFGASTAASFVAAHPERVLSLTLVAPAGLIRENQFGDLGKSYLRGGEGLEESAHNWVIDLLGGGPLVVPPDWKERFARGEVVAEAVRDWQMKHHPGHRASVVAIFRDGGALEKHGEFAKAARTGIKCRCILGELDDVASVQDLNEVGMQNVAVVPNVGHSVVRDKVPEVAQLIEDFWHGLS
ncbi:putative valacyclovir hydrolase [Mariannaea sp. PMI_226]|nr:putative valacyclovir hydrolase [Mariannaea sp. PMI_226]